MALDEAHLNSILQGANDFGTDVRTRRVSAFQIIDYYMLVMEEAGNILERDWSRVSPATCVAELHASIPGLKQLDLLQGLNDLRNKLSHDYKWAPQERQLRTYIDKAESIKHTLLKAAAETANRLSHLSEFARLLMQTAAEVESSFEEVSDNSTKREYLELARRARARARTDKAEPTIEDIVMLKAMAERVAEIRVERDYAFVHDFHEPDFDPAEHWEPADFEPPEPDYDPRDFWDHADFEPLEPEYDPGDHEPSEREYDPSDYEPPESEYDPGEYEPPEPDES